MSNIGFITVHGHYEAISHLIFIQDNAFENFVWKMVAILSQLQCVNLVYPEELIHYGLVMPFGEDLRPPSHYLSQHWHITNEVLWYWLLEESTASPIPDPIPLWQTPTPGPRRCSALTQTPHSGFALDWRHSSFTFDWRQSKVGAIWGEEINSSGLRKSGTRDDHVPRLSKIYFRCCCSR